ncbi:GNAT family N-acetyltransferase [Actinocrispum wychmicini]|uniref:GNAT family N-acetyltransferase n=1 Tax=Actinocrispum wychmicini TaxID=1213861 RepID=UPI001404B3CB|nr:GNAT family N-acetyltransferase [Actinocrispum wychmicini]
MRDSRTVSGRDLLRVNGFPTGDITIVGTTAPNASRLPRDFSFVLPMRVHFVVDFNADTESVIERIARGERRNFRQKCRQHKWDLDIERDPGWFDHFYDRIYRATMFQRHRERERTESRESAYECLFRNGILFVLRMDGRRAGGHLCHWDRTTGVLTSRLLGVLDGADEYYAAGALKVMHILLIEWAGRNGVRQLDFQGTEAFLSKGTYQFKRLFGTRVTLPPNHFGDKRLWLQVRRDTPQVRDFLVANPFLAVTDDGTMEAVYFHDEHRVARTEYKSNSPGVVGVRHVNLTDFLAEISRHDGSRPAWR